MGSSRNVLYDMMVFITRRKDRLNEWESKFCKEIAHRIDHGLKISPKQFKIIRNIWVKI